jgi:flavorubredoxin
MWDATKHMAEAIAAGIKSVDNEVTIKLYNVGRADKNDVIAEVFKSRMVLAGSSTINKGILSAMAATLEMIKGLGFKNKKGAAFGSYGWSGESVAMLNEDLKKAGFEVVDEGIKALWNPDEDALKACYELGQKLGKL